MDDIIGLSENASSKIMDRREQIISHNNATILEVIINQEHIMLDFISRYYFTSHFKINRAFNNFIKERMSFMDRYKIIYDLAKDHKIELIKQKEFQDYIKIRNNIAHNISGPGSASFEIWGNDTVETEYNLILGGDYIPWEEYLSKINIWAETSKKLAIALKEFFTKGIVKRYFSTLGNGELYYPIEDNEFFPFCELYNECVLIEGSLIYPPNPNHEEAPTYLKKLEHIAKLADEEFEYSHKIKLLKSENFYFD